MATLLWIATLQWLFVVCKNYIAIICANKVDTSSFFLPLLFCMLYSVYCFSLKLEGRHILRSAAMRDGLT